MALAIGTRVKYDTPDELEDTTGLVVDGPDHQGAIPVYWYDNGQVESVHEEVLVTL